MRRMLWLTLATLAFAMAAPTAHAHLMNTGFGPFYDGLTHLFVSPEDLLPVIALACLAGLRGSECGRVVLFTLPAAWIAGSFLGLMRQSSLAWPVGTVVLTVGLGALVAADKRLPLWFVISGAIVLGLLHGIANGVELARQPSVAFGVMGIVVALFVVVALLAGQVAVVRAAWARIVVRVAGSWIAAMGLFMLGWSVRGAR